MKLNRTLAIGLGAVLALTGCTTITSSKYDATYSETAKNHGIPYNLPMAMMKVDVSIKRDSNESYQDIEMDMAPIVVPDPNNLFYLQSPEGLLFTTKHSIATKNGLLTSINTEDDGVTGDIALALVDTATNILKIKAGGSALPTAQSGGQKNNDDDNENNIFYKGNEPASKEEIAHALNSISVDKLSFTYFDSGHKESIPGTSQLLYVESSYATKVSGKAVALNSTSTDPGTYQGIYARTLVPVNTESKLIFNTSALKGIRQAAIKSRIEALSENIDTFDAQMTLATTLEGNSCAYISEYDEDRSISQITAAELIIPQTETARREAYQACIEAIQSVNGRPTAIEKDKVAREKLRMKLNSLSNYSEGHIELTVVKGAALVPDVNNIVRIPVTRSPLGKTTNKLTFENGMLTAYESEKPSPVLALANMVSDVLKGVVAIPSELVQFKIDTTNKSRELLEAQLKFEGELDKLQGTQREITEIKRKTDLIESELGLESSLDKQSGVQYQTTVNDRLAKLAESEEAILTAQLKVEEALDQIAQLDVMQEIQQNKDQVELINSQVAKANAYQIALLNAQLEMNHLTTKVVDSEIDRLNSDLQKLAASDPERQEIQNIIDSLNQQTKKLNAEIDNLDALKKRLEAEAALEDAQDSDNGDTGSGSGLERDF